MPSVNIKTTYGAVGDGQRVTATITAVQGSTTVSSTTAVWTPVTDVGKAIFIEGIGDPNAPNNAAHLTTITAVAEDGKSITIEDAVATEVSASSQTITFGTDDASAFHDFNVANLGVANVTLTIPAGIYLLKDWAADPDAYWLRGIPDVQVVGSGSPLLAGRMFLGGFTHSQQTNSFPHSVRIATARAGATTLQLVTPAQYTRIEAGHTYTLSNGTVVVVGTKLALCGLDTQGLGFPQNPYYKEYVRVTNINSGTGVVTLAAPIRHTYLDTWPCHNDGVSGNGLDQGGPATLYALDESWDTSITITGVWFYTPLALCSMNVRDFRINNCTWLNQYGPDPSYNETWIADGCDLSACRSEIDKMVTNVIIRNGTTWDVIHHFSASVDNMTIDDSTITTNLRGTPKNLHLTNNTIGNLQLGPEGYGFTQTIYASGNVISAVDSTRTALNEDVISGGAQTFTISNGVLTSNGPPIRWGVPGAIVNFSGQQSSETNFRVHDVNGSGDLLTSMHGSSGFPNVPKIGGTELDLQVIPYLIGVFANNTGCDDIVDLSQAGARGKKFGEYSRRTYTLSPSGSQIAINSANGTGPVMYGQLRSLVINVSAAFTTAGTLLMHVLGQFRANAIDLPAASSSFTSWLPKVDLKTSGTRTWTYGSGWSGTAGADSLADPSNVWLCGLQGVFTSATVSGGDPGVVSIEIVTDQGFRMVAPLRFHA